MNASAEIVADAIRRGVGPRCVVLTDPAAQGSMRSDESGIVGPVPVCTVRPGDVDDVCRVVRICAAHGAAVVPRGGGTGLEGGAVPVDGCVVIDTTTIDGVNYISPENRVAYVQAGVTADRLNRLLGQHGLFFPVSPTGAGENATIGGLISTNARGMYALRYGSAGDSLLAVDVVMADGTLARFGHRVHHSSSGLNMAALFAGAEGTLGVIVAAIIGVHPVPPSKHSIFIDFDALSDAAAFCAQVAAFVPEAAAIEIVSAATIRTIMETLPDAGFPAMGESLVMIEIHAHPDAAILATETILAMGADFAGHEYRPPADSDLWADRHRFTRQISAMSDDGHPYRFDAAVPLTGLRDYMDALSAYVAAVPGRPPACIFGHAGAGIVHVLLPAGNGPGLWSADAARAFRESAMTEALALGGTASGEHGIGMTSIPACARENASALPWMRAVKRALDPAGIMNPGKVLDCR